jgi:predicted phage terminase large subunit-like protein
MTGQIWILDVRRGQWGADKRNATIKATANADGQGMPITMEEEPGSSGKLDSLISVRDLSGFKVYPMRPTGSKELRADIFSAHVNAGNVYLPMGAPWIWAYVDELANFPQGTYKDQVDASSLAFDWLFRKRKPGAM